MSANLLNRIFGAYLFALAIVIAVQFTVEFLYASALEVWFVLDWFTLVGFMIVVASNFLYMRFHGTGNEVTWGRIASSTAFYISLGLTLAFLHNFVANLAGSKDDMLFWKFINVVQIPLFATTGFRLLNVRNHESR